MNIFQKAKKNQKGFTLVELMVVVVIIGILVAIAVPVYNSTQERAKNQANKANIRIIEGAVQTYLMDNPEATIEGLNGEINETDDHPLKSYFKEIPKSPDGKFYTIDNGKVEESIDNGEVEESE